MFLSGVLLRYKVFAAVLFCFALLFFSTNSFAVLCGNGIKEGVEECDNGTNNSDTRADQCRTDCTLPECGDYVVDSGEECDDGWQQNSDKIPNACRKDCKEAHCGDGVLDGGEECDDKNNNDYDGCYQCMSCYPPKDNLVISSNMGEVVKLCPGRYEFTDQGQEGIIIIQGSGVRVDASNVELVGLPRVMNSAAQNVVSPQAQNVMKSTTSKIGKRITRKKASSTQQTGTQTGSGLPPSQGSVIKQGTGIVVKGNGAVLHNANIEGFKNGIKVASDEAVLFNNRVCENGTDIVGEKPGNYGVKNICSKQRDWQENGNPGCTQTCQ